MHLLIYIISVSFNKSISSIIIKYYVRVPCILQTTPILWKLARCPLRSIDDCKPQAYARCSPCAEPLRPTFVSHAFLLFVMFLLASNIFKLVYFSTWTFCYVYLSSLSIKVTVSARFLVWGHRTHHNYGTN